MKLSTKGRYGVKAMVELALNYGTEPISIKVISKKQNISEYYLEQLFSQLRKAELIKSVRGAQGGYILNKVPSQIKISDIMNILEGPIEVSDCIDGFNCINVDSCATRFLWAKIKKSVDEVLENVTLQDIVNDYNEINNNNNILEILDSNRGE